MQERVRLFSGSRGHLSLPEGDGEHQIQNIPDFKYKGAVWTAESDFGILIILIME
jgi:hypothetical protein